MIGLRVEDVHFAYGSEQAALRGVTLAIEPGEQVAVTGANGSGKTTLARCLNGLLRPQRGQVWVGDWDTLGRPVYKLAHRVAYAFQNPDEQICQRTVWDEVAFGPRQLGRRDGQLCEQVTRALAWTHLLDLAHTHPFDLGASGRKLVTIASALAMDTPVVVMDEPTAGLDGFQQAQLAHILVELRQRGRTVLVITHDLDFAAENLDRLVLLRNGQIGADAPLPEAIANGAEPDEYYAPQVARLAGRIGLSRTPLTPAALVAEAARHRRGASPT